MLLSDFRQKPILLSSVSIVILIIIEKKKFYLLFNYYVPLLNFVYRDMTNNYRNLKSKERFNYKENSTLSF